VTILLALVEVTGAEVELVANAEVLTDQEHHVADGVQIFICNKSSRVLYISGGD
jgi:hypothetical protein